MCNKCHIKVVFEGKEICCTVNPQAGAETVSIITKAAQTKDVCIIGAGPAGMQAALTAAERGHIVRLYEKENRPGGKLALASLLPFKSRVKNFINFLGEEVQNHKNIEFFPGHEHPLNRSFVLNRIRELGIPFLCKRRLKSTEATEYCESVETNVYGISGCKFYKISDCSNEMGCFNAIHEAFKIASEL